jgi:hypothetical protein
LLLSFFYEAHDATDAAAVFAEPAIPNAVTASTTLMRIRGVERTWQATRRDGAGAAPLS